VQLEAEGEGAGSTSPRFVASASPSSDSALSTSAPHPVRTAARKSAETE